MTELKNTTLGFNNRINEAVERINDLEGRAVEPI